MPMLKLIKEVLRVGNATVPYPFVKVEVSPGFRGKPEYDPKQCIACAACTIACPPNALNMETDLEAGTRTGLVLAGRPDDPRGLSAGVLHPVRRVLRFGQVPRPCAGFTRPGGTTPRIRRGSQSPDPYVSRVQA